MCWPPAYTANIRGVVNVPPGVYNLNEVVHLETSNY